jgi:alkylation response protein AidB-like acyl-CoA dehydrogenase
MRFRILLFGSEDQKADLLPDLASGSLIYARPSPSPGRVRTLLRCGRPRSKSAGGYIINGAKTMISNGPVADRALVFAVTDPGKKALEVSCFHVSRQDQGFLLEKPWRNGLRTLTNGELIFTDCRLPPLPL